MTYLEFRAERNRLIIKHRQNLAALDLKYNGQDKSAEHAERAAKARAARSATALNNRIAQLLKVVVPQWREHVLKHPGDRLRLSDLKLSGSQESDIATLCDRDARFYLDGDVLVYRGETSVTVSNDGADLV